MRMILAGRGVPALLLTLAFTVAAPAARAEPCMDCGRVTTIETVDKKGAATGAGLVIGAVIGGVAGHQFGSGRGQDAATAAGAVGGAVAGHEIEKRRNSETVDRVTVRMDDGSTRTVHVASAQGLSTGARVRVVGNDLERF